MPMGFCINGKMKLSPKNKALQIKALLSYKDLSPFSDLLMYHEDDVFDFVKIEALEDSSLMLYISGWFHGLDRHLNRYINEIINMGFEALGSFEVYKNNHENIRYLIKGEGNRTNNILSKSTNEEVFFAYLNRERVDSDHIYLSGYIELSNGHNLSKYKNLFSDIKEYDGSKVVTCSVNKSCSTHADLDNIIKMIQENKEWINYCSIASLESDVFLEYNHYNSKDFGPEDAYSYLDLRPYREDRARYC